MRALILLLALAACTPAVPPERAILAIGDSVMAWNGDRGIPEVTAAALGRPVVDASQSLAHVTHPNALARVTGFDISRQAPSGAWDWIILTGGGNDIRSDCATPRAAATRDGLIGPDLSGDIPELIARLRARGARVAVVGYYDGAEASPTGFTPCQPEFDVMNRRFDALAGRDPGVVFLDAGDVIDPRETVLYAPDLIHPSPRGAALIGAALAQRIRAAER
ncbi:SGNH/GDSL hydrolase family protein [Jannaschia seohaensis]|uniref:Lysophospholipase L1 n=1 Tax=Jannaschia seohaensis TaxID=475081 RepID=A0A2Y9A1E3_9RHOB|nr:SGNH/GDSL hydrolase family protein [Jannaschia seohaensis]PWJ21982.1 lysophospholipase L1-like esterase [Jannaschia seohaensis]SSA38260.1 Lysophospholipase L1 [Jannaschia seohaensis]